MVYFDHIFEVVFVTTSNDGRLMMTDELEENYERKGDHVIHVSPYMAIPVRPFIYLCPNVVYLS